MKKLLLSLLIIFTMFVLVGCGTMPSKGGYSPYPGRNDSGIGTDGNNGNYQPAPGQLTAGEWSDIEHYEDYINLFSTYPDGKIGEFVHFYKKCYFDTLNMVDVKVTSKGDVVTGAKVKLIDDSDNVIYQSVTNALGKAYLFPKKIQLDAIKKVNVIHGTESITIDYEYSIDKTSLEVDIDTVSDKKEEIELMFVIDTTGSMGDELYYLISEIDNVISRVSVNLPKVTIKLALLFYRDNGDDYVTRYFDFTTDIKSQKYNLANQSASGGGDFEEAVDIALSEAVSKDWSQDNTTKLLIHVLDAPPHETQTNMTRYYNAIYDASKKGIRMIPVASSGINKYTEYLLRNEALMTGGTYVFLTDHSGIGNGHLDPSIEEYVVEYLNLLLVRIISEYHLGTKLEKVPYYNQNK